MSEWDTETAEWYAEKYGAYATNKLCVESLKLEADFVVIDIGCGTECALRHVSEQVTNGSLIGIDPVPRMIEIAREKTSGHTTAVFFGASFLDQRYGKWWCIPAYITAGITAYSHVISDSGSMLFGVTKCAAGI